APQRRPPRLTTLETPISRLAPFMYRFETHYINRSGPDFSSRNVQYRTVLLITNLDTRSSGTSRRLPVKISAVVLLAFLAALGASTAAQAQTAVSSENNQVPVYRINVVSRTTRAVSYKHRSGSTKINFQGTDLMPSAAGEAKVESKRGALAIEVELSGLDRPTAFGNEYLTYVLWAISPEG